MRALNRPIVIIDPNGRVRNRDAVQRDFVNPPIFVYYNDHNHYDGYTLADDVEDGSVVVLEEEDLVDYEEGQKNLPDL